MSIFSVVHNGRMWILGSGGIKYWKWHLHLKEWPWFSVHVWDIPSIFSHFLSLVDNGGMLISADGDVRGKKWCHNLISQLQLCVDQLLKFYVCVFHFESYLTFLIWLDFFTGLKIQVSEEESQKQNLYVTRLFNANAYTTSLKPLSVNTGQEVWAVKMAKKKLIHNSKSIFFMYMWEAAPSRQQQTASEPFGSIANITNCGKFCVNW